MSNYTFPTGVTHKQYYITGADLLPDNYQYDVVTYINIRK